MAARVGITTKTPWGDVGLTMWTWMAVLMNTYCIAWNKATKQTTENPYRSTQTNLNAGNIKAGVVSQARLGEEKTY